MPPRKPTAPPARDGEEKTEADQRSKSPVGGDRTELARSPYLDDEEEEGAPGEGSDDQDLPTDSQMLEDSIDESDEAPTGGTFDDEEDQPDVGSDDDLLAPAPPVLSPADDSQSAMDPADDDSLGSEVSDDHSGSVAGDEASDIYGDEDDYPSEDREYLGPAEDDEPSRSRGGDTNPGAHTQAAPEAPESGAPEDEEENPDATNAGPPIRLQIIAGPDEGKWKKIRGVRMVIGRVAGCDLKLSDQSVSRRHLELVQGEKGVLLRDLGSGNGTKVNGEKVTEQMLQHDDEIAIGKTVFRYVDETAAFQRHRDAAEKEEAEQNDPPDSTAGVEGDEGHEEGPDGEAAEEGSVAASALEGPAAGAAGAWQRLQPAQRMMAFGGVAGLGLIALVVVLVGSSRKKAAMPSDLRVARAGEKIQQARAAVAAKHFSEAQAFAAQAKAIFPGAGDGRLDAEIESGRAHEVANEVRAAIAERRFDDAHAALAQLPPSDPMRERDRLASDLRIKEGEERARQAEAALARQRLEQARQDRQREERRQTEQAEREVQLDSAFTSVARKFHAGEYRRAAAECDRVLDEAKSDTEIRARAKQLQALIPAFGTAFEDGHRKFKAGQLVSAVRPLRRARELYFKIGFTGALGAQVDEELAASALAAGKDALDRDDLAAAGPNLLDAVKLDAGDTRAKEALDRFNSKIERLLVEAAQLKSKEPLESIGRYKRVLAATPSNSPAHEKARANLAQLQR